MSGNTFGKIYQLHSFGESHGKAVGGIVEGFPANFSLDIDKIKFELLRRRTNQGIYSSSRNEVDDIQFLSGIFESKTLGTPIGFVVENKGFNSKDYIHLKDVYRPSHADFTWDSKYGYRDYRGGGRSSARETLSRVVAGAMAKQFLENNGIEIRAWVHQIYDVKSNISSTPKLSEIENSSLRCPDKVAESKMQKRIEQAINDGDTLGGIIECRIIGVPAGLGEPVFDKLNAALAHAMISINAAKGFEYGCGFDAAEMTGSEHNDEFDVENNEICTKTNNSGGIQGGISNGQEINFKVAFKPVASILKKQNTVNKNKEKVELSVEGRHDVCVVPRAVPIVEAMAAIVLMDFYLLQKINY